MTKKLSVVFSAVALVLAISAPLAAQTSPLRANIPFEFSVGGKTLPAGEYSIQSRNTDGSILAISNPDSTTAAMVLASRGSDWGKERGQAKLIFHRYGSSYFLSEIWNGFATVGYALPVTRTERELSRTASVQTFQVLAYLAQR